VQPIFLLSIPANEPLDFFKPNEIQGVNWWKSMDGTTRRAYLSGAQPQHNNAVELQLINELKGVNFTQLGDFHYIVETDIPANAEADFNDWYNNEHLPGLASVPGTISAKRYVRQSGAPKYIACYELASPQVMEQNEWLAVRNTDWSSRIRPMFLNTVRTLFTRDLGIS